MAGSEKLLQTFCSVVNAVKRTGLHPAVVGTEQFLGGDLGIDSIEMLEIWFRLEKALSIRIPDDSKRDIYTVGEVLAVLARCQPAPLAGEEIAHVQA